MHSFDYFHRDIKPQNILLDIEGNSYITDFGLAKKLEKGKKLAESAGTIEYMAPEMIKLDGYDKMVDWWAFGCVVYEMLVG